MNFQTYGKGLSVLLLLALFFSSCNTYQWQRKRYYQGDKSKNWNNYNNKKTEKDKEKELERYYKKD